MIHHATSMIIARFLTFSLDRLAGKNPRAHAVMHRQDSDMAILPAESLVHSDCSVLTASMVQSPELYDWVLLIVRTYVVPVIIICS